MAGQKGPLLKRLGKNKQPNPVPPIEEGGSGGIDPTKPISKNNPPGPALSKNTQFKPGNNANPLGGKAHKLPEIKTLMAMTLGNTDKDGISNAQKIISAMITKAMKGDVKATQFLFDRGYGKAIEYVQQTNMNGNFDLSDATPEVLAKIIEVQQALLNSSKNKSANHEDE